LAVYFEGRGCRQAEDLADEAIARLVAYARTIDFDGNADALAFGIGKNVLREWLRETAASTATSDPGALGNLPAPAPDDRSAARAARAVAALEPEDRELLEQYYLDRLTAGQMAAQWGLSAAGVRTRVFRLRNRLLRIVAAEGHEAETRGQPNDIPK
jgi:RNA polymerase sigma factor (sigma-70 family)